MTIASCQHCDQQIFWFARHSRWLHCTSHSRYCAGVSPIGLTQAEPIASSVFDDVGGRPLPV